MSTPRTKVEIIDPTGNENLFVRSREIHINGEAVCVEAGSLLIEYEDSEVVKVHLTILPDSLTFKRAEPTKVRWQDPAPRTAEATSDMRKILTVVADAKAGKRVVICGSRTETRNVFEGLVELLGGYIDEVFWTNGREILLTYAEGSIRVINSPNYLRGMAADTVWLVDEPKTEDELADWIASIHPLVGQNQNRTVIYPTD